jgi:NADH:ubiquinone oxidoreductase subunit
MKTDNDWVSRIGQLRQLIEDSYDEGTATPEEWVAWIAENVELDNDDIEFLRRELRRRES